MKHCFAVTSGMGMVMSCLAVIIKYYLEKRELDGLLDFVEIMK